MTLQVDLQCLGDGKPSKKGMQIGFLAVILEGPSAQRQKKLLEPTEWYFLIPEDKHEGELQSDQVATQKFPLAAKGRASS